MPRYSATLRRARRRLVQRLSSKASRRLSPGVGSATAILHQSTCVLSQAQRSHSESRSLCNRTRAPVNEQYSADQGRECHESTFEICPSVDVRTSRTQRTGWTQTALGGAAPQVIS